MSWNYPRSIALNLNYCAQHQLPHHLHTSTKIKVCVIFKIANILVQKYLETDNPYITNCTSDFPAIFSIT